MLPHIGQCTKASVDVTAMIMTPIQVKPSCVDKLSEQQQEAAAGEHWRVQGGKGLVTCHHAWHSGILNY